MVEGKSIIQQLYDGEINIYEHTTPTDPEHKAVLDKIAVEKNYFQKALSPGDYERLETFQNYIDKAADFDNRAAFAYAVKFAVRLMVETLANDGGADKKD